MTLSLRAAEILARLPGVSTWSSQRSAGHRPRWTRLANLVCTSAAIIALSGGITDAAPRPDLNGDGKTDIVWRNTVSGQTVAWLMNGTAATSNALLMGDPAWVVTAFADFNGDGKTDLVWRNTVSGQTAIWLMNGPTAPSSEVVMSGANWGVTATGDFNGDANTDLVWRKSRTGHTEV